MVRVSLTSELYGREFFRFTNFAEALAAITKLHSSSRKAYKEDGVPREIAIHVGSGPGETSPYLP